MAFEVQDVRDLIRLLQQHPEWRDEVRRVVLTDELLELPSVVRELVEAQRRTETRVGELVEAQRRTETRVEELAEAQRRTEARGDQLATRLEALALRLEELARMVARLADTVDALATVVKAHDVHLSDLRGKTMAVHYRDHAYAYFAPIAKRIRVLEPSSLADLLADAVERDVITSEEARQIGWADIVAHARDVYLVVEVSVQVALTDVARARDRARLLARLGVPTIGVVAGESVTEEAAAIAKRDGIWQVTDGAVLAPDPAA